MGVDTWFHTTTNDDAILSKLFNLVHSLGLLLEIHIILFIISTSLGRTVSPNADSQAFIIDVANSTLL